MARIDGQLQNAQLEVVANLPSGPQPLNRLVQYSGDAYRWNGTSWVRFIDTGSIVNVLAFFAPAAQRILTGSGNVRHHLWFNVITANATAGATYTNNGVTFTVVKTITSGGTLLLLPTTAGTPFSTGVLTKTSGTGDATINYGSVKYPIYSIVEACGGGAAGGSGNNAGASGAGGATAFSTISLNGGLGGASASAQTNGPMGGLVAGTFPSNFMQIVSVKGGQGATGGAGTSTFNVGGTGGLNAFGYSVSGGTNAAGATAEPNTGSGGGGGGVASVGSLAAGSGGGAGAYAKFLIQNPPAGANYSYSVAGGGAPIAAGANGFAGGSGGSGIIIMTDYFQ